MTIDKELALSMWKYIYGENTIYAVDCYGIYMHRDDYGDRTRTRVWSDGKYYSFGWELDHIRPKSDFSNESESNLLNNLEPVHHNNNEAKADNYPYFKINNKEYKVVKCQLCEKNNALGYGIIDISSNSRVDWKGRQNRYYK